MATRVWSTGRVRANETEVVFTPSNLGRRAPICVHCHGAGATPASYDTAVNRALPNFMAASAGFIVIVAELAGINTWGDDDFLGAVDDAVDFAVADLDGDPEQLVITGESMGGMGGLGYHWRNTDRVRASLHIVPVVNGQAVYDRNAGLATLMDDAYQAQGGWANVQAERDPSAAGPLALVTAFAEDVRLYYGNDDPTVIPDDVLDYSAATGVAAFNDGNVGHSAAGLPVRDATEWLLDKAKGG